MKKFIVYCILIFTTVITLTPFVYLFCGSMKNNDDFLTYLFLPLGNGPLGVAWNRLSFSHYHQLFFELGFAKNILNSLFLASVTSVLATLCCAMGGYALAKFNFRGRFTATLLVLGSLIIPAALLIAPTYDLLFHLHLLNTYSGLILPAITPAFGVFLFRQATIAGLPNTLIEAARMDGCGEARIFFGIALPMVKPMIGAFLLITFLGTWNNFISPQIVLQDAGRFPLSVAVAQLRGIYGEDYGLMMAGTVVSALPVLGLFLLLQQEFIAGLTSGAVKG